MIYGVGMAHPPMQPTGGVGVKVDKTQKEGELGSLVEVSCPSD